MPGGPRYGIGKTQRKSARVTRVLRVSTWELESGCESQTRSRTPKHVAVGAILELRPPIFAGFFHVRGGWGRDLTENGTSSVKTLNQPPLIRPRVLLKCSINRLSDGTRLKEYSLRSSVKSG